MNKHSHQTILIIETAPGVIETKSLTQVSSEYLKDSFRITSNSPNSSKIANAWRMILSRYAIESKQPILQ